MSAYGCKFVINDVQGDCELDFRNYVLILLTLLKFGCKRFFFGFWQLIIIYKYWVCHKKLKIDYIDSIGEIYTG